MRIYLSLSFTAVKSLINRFFFSGSILVLECRYSSSFCLTIFIATSSSPISFAVRLFNYFSSTLIHLNNKIASFFILIERSLRQSKICSFLFNDKFLKLLNYFTFCLFLRRQLFLSIVFFFLSI